MALSQCPSYFGGPICWTNRILERMIIGKRVWSSTPVRKTFVPDINYDTVPCFTFLWVIPVCS